MIQTQAFLSRLEGVRQLAPDRWVARCSSHGDKYPSLSIRVTDDRILMHCFSGCTPEDILAAVGLTWGDLFADRWQAAHQSGLAAGHKRQRKMLSDLTQEDYARLVLKIAAADIEHGIQHTIEDRATIELAKSIMQGGRVHG